MRVEQINIGRRTPLLVGGKELKTGIFKEACTGAVAIGKLGLTGDAVCNTRHHGGPDQAVYLYSVEDYEFWARQLGKAVPAGTFGENLTVSGIDLNEICVGDVLFSDAISLQIAAPRIPCSTLAARMADKHFAKKFMQAGRSGAYCRVLEPGSLAAGDELAWSPYEGDRLPLAKFFQDAHGKLSAETLRRYLAVPIDIRTRTDFEKKLAATN